ATVIIMYASCQNSGYVDFCVRNLPESQKAGNANLQHSWTFGFLRTRPAKYAAKLFLRSPVPPGPFLPADTCFWAGISLSDYHYWFFAERSCFYPCLSPTI